MVKEVEMLNSVRYGYSKNSMTCPVISGYHEPGYGQKPLSSVILRQSLKWISDPVNITIIGVPA